MADKSDPPAQPTSADEDRIDRIIAEVRVALRRNSQLIEYDTFKLTVNVAGSKTKIRADVPLN